MVFYYSVYVVSPFKRTIFEENEITNFSKNFNQDKKCSIYLSFEDENIV